MIKSSKPIASPISCPCCNQSVVAPSADIIIDNCNLSQMQAAIFIAVWSGRGHPVPTKRIFDRMYQDDPDGGPCESTMYSRFKVSLHRLRAKLATSGVTVEYDQISRGYRIKIGGENVSNA